VNRTLRRGWGRSLVCALLTFGAFGALANGCMETPAEKYDDFIERADRMGPELSDAEVVGELVDLKDKEYLMNVLINFGNGLQLELRVLFTKWELNAAGTEAAVSGEVRFKDNGDPPITTFETVMNERGRMVISSGPVSVPADRSPLPGQEVKAQLTFVTTAISEDFICGRIEDDESKVTVPLEIPLKGTTFGAKRIIDGVLPTDVPQFCPGQSPSFDAGGTGSETGSDASADASSDTSATDDSSSGD